jgi:catechol 2,3-dioxygenase-like lactoylglutathione lyase family enzyme
MHRSRLAGLILDCRSADLDDAARFWGAALGMHPNAREDIYVPLDASARDLMIAVQQVDHESRVHLDIESDDVEAEVRRRGARRQTCGAGQDVVGARGAHRPTLLRRPGSAGSERRCGCDPLAGLTDNFRAEPA